MDLDVTQSFENEPHCGEFSLATLAEYVLAPKLNIELEIGGVYIFGFAVFAMSTSSSTIYAIWLGKIPY